MGKIKNTAKKVADIGPKIARNSREALDNAYESKRVFGQANLLRLREEHHKAKPVEVLDILANELDEQVELAANEYGDYTFAYGLYVMTAIEIYGGDEVDLDLRRKLVDTLMVLDSTSAKRAVKIGKGAVKLAYFALNFVNGSDKAVKALKVAPPAAMKMLELYKQFDDKADKFRKAKSNAEDLINKVNDFGLKLPGKATLTTKVVSLTLTTLGEPPAAWPKEAAKVRLEKWFMRLKKNIGLK